MKNYAGHRLSPWLGHLMVSRQEASRPLLTAGEIMQLPAHEEIVMVAGVAPIRALEARYYADARFTARILPPPTVAPLDPKLRPANDWTDLPPVAPPAEPAAPPAAPMPTERRETPPDPVSGQPEGNTADAANAGIRREPELGEHEEIVHLPKVDPNEFDFDGDDDGDADAARNRRQADRMMRRNARNAALDPDDGVDL